MSGGFARPAEGDLGEFIQRLQRTEERLRELERPTGTQFLRAVELLQETATYVSSGGFARVDYSVPTANTVAFIDPPSLTFTVTRTMRVQITATCNYAINADTVDAQAQLIIEVFEGDTRYLNVFEEIESGAAIRVASNAFNSSQIIFGPGTHTLNAVGEVRLFGGAGFDLIDARPIILTATVLGEN